MQFSNVENERCSITETITYNHNDRFTVLAHDSIIGSNSGFHVYNNNKLETNLQQVSLLDNCLSIGTNNDTNTNNVNVKDGSMLLVSTDTTRYPLDVKGFKGLDQAFRGFRYNTGVNSGGTNDARGIHLSLALSNSLQMGEGELYSSSDRRIKKHFTLTSSANSLSILKKIELYSYNYTSSVNQSKVYGYMAQDVEELVPSAVSTVSKMVGDTVIDDFKILNKSMINVIHHDAIRQLYNEHKALKNEQDELIAELTLIKNKL